MKIDLTNILNNADDSFLFNDKHRAIKNHKLMQWAKVATFGLYMVAVFMLYVSDVWGIASFLEKNSSEFMALGVFSVISFVLAYFLASSKEAVYEDIAIHRSEGYKLKPTQYAAMALFLSSGILFEMFSTTNNQQHIANTAAEQSTMMQSVQSTDVSVAGGSTLTGDYATAKVKLAQCEARLAQGKEKHCDGAKARVEAVKESMAMSNDLATTAAKQSMDNKVDGMLKIREHFDKPMFQAIGKATGTDNNSGMLMVIGVLIFIFECQHIMALFAYANALLRLNRSKGKVANKPTSANTPANAYQSPMGQVSPPLSAFNSAKMTVGEYAEKMEAGLKASPEIIATEYARAQHGHNQAMETFQNVAGKVGNKLDGLNKTYRQELNNGESVYSDTPLDKPRPTLPKMSVEATVKQIQASVKASGANSPTAIQAAVFDAFAAMPNPAPLNDAILERIADKLTPTSTASKPMGQSVGLTGIHSPVLGTDEEHYALPLQNPVTTVPVQSVQPRTVSHSSTVPVQSKQPRTDVQPSTASDVQSVQPANTVPVQSVQPGLTGAAKQVEADLYPEWLAQVKAGEITPGARDCKRFVSQSTFSKGDKTGLNIQEMQRIWTSWQDRAANDGVLTANPKYQPGNRQAKYLIA